MNRAQTGENSYTAFEASKPEEILSSVNHLINGDVIVLNKDNIDQVKDGGKWLVELYVFFILIIILIV